MADDGFVASLVTVVLPPGQGELDIKLRTMPVPRTTADILNLPLSRLAIKHGPRHWLMDRVVIDDRAAVLICRECYLRTEIPARAKDLYELLMFWRQRVGPSYYRLHFACDSATFYRFLAERFPAPARKEPDRTEANDRTAEERASGEGMPEPR